jgi:Fe-S cluster assembly iron-binding protein IscA/alpha/beta superfamily hydrolase
LWQRTQGDGILISDKPIFFGPWSAEPTLMPTFRCLVLLAFALTGCNPGQKLVAVEGSAEPTPALAPKAEPPAKDEERVVLTESAAKQIKKFMADLPQAKCLRVRVADDKFKLDLDTVTDAKLDFQSQSRGVPIAVDRKSASILPVGIVVDYVEDGDTKGFRFHSPGYGQATPDRNLTLADARKDFKTTLRLQPNKAVKTPVAKPPAELFEVVKYDAPLGKNTAYLSPDPKDGKKHPAIVWITGGDCNSIDAGCWRDGGAANDQSASAYRKAGIVMMFPALRGGNDNPGAKEGFLGEIDDVLAAAAFLKKQSFVDPDRVYLGGHSTGGTLVLLTSECSDAFRAVFSFGPTDDVLGYGLSDLPFVLTDPKELRLRAPGQWLQSVRSPTFVVEGTSADNSDPLRKMKAATKNAKLSFFLVQGANHFNVLAPVNRVIAEKITKDTGPKCNLAFTEDEFNQAFKK